MFSAPDRRQWDKLPAVYSLLLLLLSRFSHVQLGKLMDFSLPCSSAHGDSLSKNAGVGCHALLQGIFPTLMLRMTEGRRRRG